MMLLYTALLLAPFAAALNKSTTEPSSRIVGGQAIFTEGRFPYFAHVNICFRNNPTGCTTCGGTLIAPRAVLVRTMIESIVRDDILLLLLLLLYSSRTLFPPFTHRRLLTVSMLMIKL